MFSISTVHTTDASIKTKGIGMRLNSPALFVIYQDITTGKYRRRKIPIKEDPQKIAISQIAKNIYQRHEPFMKNIAVSEIERLLEHIQKGITPPKKVQISQKYPVITPPLSQSQTGNQKPLSDAFPGNSSLIRVAKDSVTPVKPPETHEQRKTATPIDGNLDLNKMSDDELTKYKKMMDEQFEKNRLLPGQKGFVYDVQKSFGEPTGKSEWDDSDDEEHTIARTSMITQTKIDNHIPNSLSDVSIKSHVVTNPSAILPDKVKVPDDVSDIPEDILESEEEEEVTPTQGAIKTEVKSVVELPVAPKPSLLGPLPLLGANKNGLPPLTSSSLKPLGPLAPLSKPALPKPELALPKQSVELALPGNKKEEDEEDIDDVLDMLDDDREKQEYSQPPKAISSWIKPAPIPTLHQASTTVDAPSESGESNKNTSSHPEVAKLILQEHNDVSPIVPTVVKAELKFDDDDYQDESFIEEDIASLPDDSPPNNPISSITSQPPAKAALESLQSSPSSRQNPGTPKIYQDKSPQSFPSSPKNPAKSDVYQDNDNFGQGETDSDSDVGDEDVEFEEDALDVLSFDKGSEEDEDDRF